MDTPLPTLPPFRPGDLFVVDDEHPLPPRPSAADPWGHEHGEDPDHLLTPDGHAKVHESPHLARIVGEPRPLNGAPLDMHEAFHTRVTDTSLATIAAGCGVGFAVMASAMSGVVGV